MLSAMDRADLRMISVLGVVCFVAAAAAYFQTGDLFMTATCAAAGAGLLGAAWLEKRRRDNA